MNHYVTAMRRLFAFLALFSGLLAAGAPVEATYAGQSDNLSASVQSAQSDSIGYRHIASVALASKGAPNPTFIGGFRELNLAAAPTVYIGTDRALE